MTDHHLRSSYQFDLLDDLALAYYARGVEQFFARSKKAAERLIRIEYAHWGRSNVQKPSLVLLAATNIAVYILQKPNEL